MATLEVVTSRGEDTPTAADIGLTHKDIHDARILRDAEKADPGVICRALIISRNIQTREMTASQKVMLLAIEFPEPSKGGRGKTLEDFKGFDQGLLSKARLINRWASDLAEGVIGGNPTFNSALKQAEENRQKASSREARMTRLTDGAPDLARQVIEETLTLDEAVRQSGELQTRLAEIEAEANRKRSESLKGNQNAVKNGAPTSSGRTVSSGSTNARAEAMAAASRTNRGSVERMLALEKARPDLAAEVRLGKKKPTAALRVIRRNRTVFFACGRSRLVIRLIAGPLPPCAAPQGR